MCKRNLRRQEKVVVGDVRHRVMEAVLEFHDHAAPELFDIELLPGDAELLAHRFCFSGGNVCPYHTDLLKGVRWTRIDMSLTEARDA